MNINKLIQDVVKRNLNLNEQIRKKRIVIDPNDAGTKPIPPGPPVSISAVDAKRPPRTQGSEGQIDAPFDNPLALKGVRGATGHPPPNYQQERYY